MLIKNYSLKTGQYFHHDNHLLFDRFHQHNDKRIARIDTTDIL